MTDLESTIERTQVGGDGDPPPPTGDMYEFIDTGPSIPPPQPRPAQEVTRQLIVLSDGTGNSAAKAEKTNVWRMFQALDQTSSRQLAMYDDGVGTSSYRLLALLGGVFGWGLERNVIELYKFICRNYQDQTRIMAFGFSRGAFTIRVLIGLITQQGLVRFGSEAELDRNAHRAYAAFRRSCFRPPLFSPVYLYRVVAWLFRGIAKLLRRTSYSGDDNVEVKEIDFLGVWDTVSAYGMPVAELRPVINWLFWPMNFSDLTLSRKVKRACHALSLDDERATFHPIIWDQKTDEDMKRISQVWFPGSHANVGGGYAEDQLSLVSLEWMMTHASAAGVRLIPSVVQRVADEKSAYARIYDSREGFGMFYRYSPRTVRGGAFPVIHGSVIARMARGRDEYAPSALPAAFAVLAPDGSLLQVRGRSNRAIRTGAKRVGAHGIQVSNAALARQRTQDLIAAIGDLNRPLRATEELIDNAVWWRRFAYLCSFATVALLVSLPLFADRLHEAIGHGKDDDILTHHVGMAAIHFLLALDKTLNGVIRSLFQAVEGLLPSFSMPWLRSIVDHPMEYALLGVVLYLLLRVSTWLERAQLDYSRLAWQRNWNERYRGALTSAERSHAYCLTILILVLNGAGIAYRLGTKDSVLRASLVQTVAFVDFLALVRLWWHLHAVSVLADPTQRVNKAWALHRASSAVRSSRTWSITRDALAGFLLPALFGLALLAAIFFAGNRVLFDVRNGAGAFCQKATAEHAPHLQGGAVDVALPFSTNAVCWSTGVKLKEQTRYRVIMQNTANWQDGDGHRVDMQGLDDNKLDLHYLLATPLKRSWTAPWFMPMVHIGIKGGEEYPLTSCVHWTHPKDSVPETKELVAEFKTEHDGELFLFVNDAVLGWTDARYFYRNHTGKAKIRIEEIHNDATSLYHAYCPR